MGIPEGRLLTDDAPPAGVRTWWRGRFGRALLVEIVLMVALLTLYRLGRYLGRDEMLRAFRHAREVLAFEQAVGIGNEDSLQRIALGHIGAVRLLNRYYATAHFPVTAAFLVLCYLRTPAIYRQIRAILVAVTAAGLVLHIAYPLAPPRMMSGFVDTVAVYGPSIYDRPGVQSVANQYAAMPSLHVGWAVIVAYGLYLMWSGRRRWLGAGHAAMTIIAVVVTANHYWADIVVALVLVLAATVVVRRRARDAEEADYVVAGSCSAMRWTTDTPG
jgi:hypothetical protein